MATYKPFKIKLSNGTASGMYLLANEDEIKFDKDGIATDSFDNSKYKIENDNLIILG